MAKKLIKKVLNEKFSEEFIRAVEGVGRTLKFRADEVDKLLSNMQYKFAYSEIVEIKKFLISETEQLLRIISNEAQETVKKSVEPQSPSG